MFAVDVSFWSSDSFEWLNVETGWFRTVNPLPVVDRTLECVQIYGTMMMIVPEELPEELHSNPEAAQAWTAHTMTDVSEFIEVESIEKLRWHVEEMPY